MRVDLPGTPGTVNTYYVMVRASSPNLSNLTGGLSEGAYTLNIRLQNEDQYPGSVVRDADIRDATNGVEVIGKPEHSPLEGDTAQSISTSNGTIDTAQNLGDPLQSSNNQASVAAGLQTSSTVDWFQIEMGYADLATLETIEVNGNLLQTFALEVSAEFADGLNRPDLTISIFDATGNLLFVSRDSDVTDAQATPDSGADTANQRTAVTARRIPRSDRLTRRSHPPPTARRTRLRAFTSRCRPTRRCRPFSIRRSRQIRPTRWFASRRSRPTPCSAMRSALATRRPTCNSRRFRCHCPTCRCMSTRRRIS